MNKLLLPFLLLSFAGFAQPSIFHKSALYEKFETITPIDSGRYIVAGGTFSPSLCVLDSTGLVFGSYVYNGLSGPFEYCRFFPTADSGGLLIAREGGANSHILKVDKDLQPQWSRTIVNAKIAHAKETSDGKVILTGLKSNSGFVAKIDTQGNFLWSRAYGHSQKVVSFNSLSLMDSTSYLCVGVAQNDVLLVSVDTAGNILWARKFSGIGMATNTIQESGGEIVFAGCSIGLNVELIKIDNTGNIISNSSYDFSQSFNNLYTHSILSTTDGGYVVTGANINGFMFKTDSIGNLVWSKKYGVLPNDITQSVEQIDGSYIAVGNTNVYLGIYSGDLLKIDTAGNTGTCDSSFFPPVLSPLVTSDTINLTASVSSINSVAVQVTRSNSILSFQDTCQTPWGGVEDVAEDNYRLYPNPTRERICLESQRKVNDILIYDQLGRVVGQKALHSKTSTIDVSGLLPGIYFYRVRFENDLFTNGKLLIE